MLFGDSDGFAMEGRKSLDTKDLLLQEWTQELYSSSISADCRNSSAHLACLQLLANANLLHRAWTAKSRSLSLHALRMRQQSTLRSDTADAVQRTAEHAFAFIRVDTWGRTFTISGKIDIALLLFSSCFGYIRKRNFCVP